MKEDVSNNGKKRVVIVGGGLGGLELATRLVKTHFQVTLIDKNNYNYCLLYTSDAADDVYQV